VICGMAPIARSTTASDVTINGQVLKCGGSNVQDNSGELDHVRIERGQGLVLVGVGFGTVLQNLEAGFCSGIGIRVKGGTINLRRVSVVYNFAVGILFESAYSGKVQHVYAQVPDIASARAIQVSGRDTSPIFSHATLIGSRDKSTEVMHFSEGGGGVFVNMLLVHYQGVGVYHECTDSRNVSQPISSGGDNDGLRMAVDHSELVFPQENTLWNPLRDSNEWGTQVLSIGCATHQTLDISKMRTGTGSNPNFIAFPQALGPWTMERSRVIDVRPTSDSSLLNVEQTNPAFYEPIGSHSFFDVEDQIGAFSPSDLWITFLSGLDTELHALPANSPGPDMVLCGKIDGVVVVAAGSNVLVTCSLVITGRLEIHDDVMVRVLPQDMSLEGHVPFIIVKVCILNMICLDWRYVEHVSRARMLLCTS
jgi:hypothetical protein